MKLFAAGLIICSCGAMGLLVASSYTMRVRNLKQLMNFMQVLESEIHFARTTLPDLIAQQAPQFSGAVGRFLAVLRDQLEDGAGESFSAVWAQGLTSLSSNGLPPSVLEDLRACGNALGRSDAAEQSKHVQQLIFRLEQALGTAERDREQHVRLWQYLGFCAGLLIVLLLF